MQKISLITFSLFIASILFIAGCQDAVGIRTGSGKSSGLECSGYTGSYGQAACVQDRNCEWKDGKCQEIEQTPCSQIRNPTECRNSMNCVYTRDRECVDNPKKGIAGCEDSDGGDDPLNKGTVIGGGLMAVDNCLYTPDSSPLETTKIGPDLVEFMCEGSDGITQKRYYCGDQGEGYACRDGACVKY